MPEVWSAGAAVPYPVQIVGTELLHAEARLR